jgi:hypothetical protein
MMRMDGSGQSCAFIALSIINIFIETKILLTDRRPGPGPRSPL